MEADNAKCVGSGLHTCGTYALHFVAETCFCFLKLWQVIGLEELIGYRLVGFFLNGRARIC